MIHSPLLGKLRKLQNLGGIELPAFGENLNQPSEYIKGGYLCKRLVSVVTHQFIIFDFAGRWRAPPVASCASCFARRDFHESQGFFTI